MPQISSIFHFDQVSDGQMAHVLGVNNLKWFNISQSCKTPNAMGENNAKVLRVFMKDFFRVLKSFNLTLIFKFPIEVQQFISIPIPILFSF